MRWANPAWLPDHALTRAADWLLTKEVRRKGDWSVKRPNVEPSGWYFEFANEFYPDIDDTAQVLLALAQSRGIGSGEAGRLHASARSTGCWRCNRRTAAGPRSTSTTTGIPERGAVRRSQRHARSDVSGYHRARARSADGLRASSAIIRPSGAASSISSAPRKPTEAGTGAGASITFTARSWRCAACKPRAKAIAKPTSCAPANGCARFRTPMAAGAKAAPATTSNTFVAAPSTPSQTAWAILGLIAGGDTTSSSVHKGIEYLMETQRADGGWDEDLSTGTGFPGVFYLQYHFTAIRSRCWRCPAT